uniref:TFIIS N-terminal domain-containing protein n=1 Tax=Panagrellus redivivus TaxID=6233 RepID=A0A7E4W3S3_PANRE
MSATGSTISKIVADVKKYMEQLKKEKKIGHALRRLNRIDMTIEVLKETLVGKEVRKLLSNHPEHGQFARALVKKWMALFEATAPAESRKRPAEDMTADDSKAKKPRLTPSTTSISTPIQKPVSPPAEPVKPDNEELFEIQRKHTQSRVYSGKQTALDVVNENVPALPTISSMMRGPSKCDYFVVSSVLPFRRDSSPDKPAPMMAKTIKMMQNRYRR